MDARGLGWMLGDRDTQAGLYKVFRINAPNGELTKNLTGHFHISFTFFISTIITKGK